MRHSEFRSNSNGARPTSGGILFAVVVLLAAGLSVAGQTASTGSSQIEQRIQRIQNGILPPLVIQDGGSAPPTLAQRMTALRVPGISIAVIHDGKIEWARGFGVMKTGGPAVTPDTLFQTASISKPVSALAILRLVQSGKLNLDADVNLYLKSWRVPENQFTQKAKVTLRYLLTHTAGTTVHGFGGYVSEAPLPSIVQILNGQRPANSPAIFVDTVPGTAWRYSGGGYTIAQLLLEDVTGLPFAKLLSETVLAPLGMTSSTYEQPLPKERLAEAATPHAGNGEAIRGGAHTYPEMAAAGLWTTASDLARYAIEVQQALSGKSNRVLSTAMTREMLTPGRNGWGLGPGTGGSTERPYFTHSGSNAGFQSNLVAYHNGDGVVILTNGDNGGQLATEITRTVAHVYEWPNFRPIVRSVSTVDPRVLDGYAGDYQGEQPRPSSRVTGPSFTLKSHNANSR